MLFLFFQKVDPEVVFTKQERIGKGSFGEVFKGIDNRTQQVNKHFFGGQCLGPKQAQPITMHS